MAIGQKDMKWICPYCGKENTDTIESLDYEPAMCVRCNKVSEVWFDIQPIDVIVKGID